MDEARKDQLRLEMRNAFNEHGAPNQGDVYILYTGTTPENGDSFLTSDDIQGAFFNAAHDEDGITVGIVGWRKEDTDMADQALLNYAGDKRFLTVKREEIFQPTNP